MRKFLSLSVLFTLVMLFSFANVSSAAATPALAGGSYTMTDLGTFNNVNVRAFDINDVGQVIGEVENEAFVWQNGVMTNLGGLGGNYTSPADINNVGQVVGFSNTSDGGQRAFFWDNGTMIDLGTLGGNNSTAEAVNDAGQVAGDSNMPDGTQHAFFWDNGPMTDLGTLGGSSSRVFDINKYGQVVGNASISGDTASHAFIWQNGTMDDLGTLGGDYSSAIAINDAGQVIGTSDTANGERHSFLWDNGRMIDLGTLNDGTSDATEIRVTAINENGQIVGNAGFGRRGPTLGFLWENGSMISLGTLSGGDSSRATAINNNGQVVGSSRTADGDSRAFVWQNGTMTDLGTLGGSDSDATAINETGQVVGSSATTAWWSHAFIATISLNTPVGSNVSVQPVDATSGVAPVTLTFAEITQAGTTSLTTSGTGTPPPNGFKLGNPPVYYDLSTTAVFVGPVTLCIDYTGISFGNESNIKLNHYENGAWADRTISLDTQANIICASVPSLSPFAIFEPENIAPTAVAGGPYLVAVESSVAFDGSGSSDPDQDTLTETWTADGGSVSGSTYTAGAVPGIYDVCLTVNDGSVDSEPDCTIVVVYDPSGGFVTGGGWIDSPENAYKADPTLTGKATFGFVAKYKKGANVPDGNTEFQFKAGDLNFKSSNYEWLVVAGNNAKFKGEGTINGQGSYKFMISADDDNPDTFRIQIWGDNGTVYDNGSQQSLGGGSIVVHARSK